MTSWGSHNAEGMFNIATRLAGFDPRELMIEINRRSKSDKVNERTVLNAMQAIVDHEPDYNAHVLDYYRHRLGVSPSRTAYS